MSSMPCPRCNAALAPHGHDEHAAWTCAAGRHGVLMPLAPLKRDLAASVWLQLDDLVRQAPTGDAACPRCRVRMRHATVSRGSSTEVALDACSACRVVWFDADEVDALRARKPAAARASASGSEAKEEKSSAASWLLGLVDLASLVLQ